MQVQFQTKKGNEFTGVVVRTNDNTYLNVLGSNFYGIKEGLKSYEVESFCEEMGIEKIEGITLELSTEEKEKVYFAMFPERRKVKFINKYEDFIIHNEGETLVRGEVWLMADGTEKKHVTFKKEF